MAMEDFQRAVFTGFYSAQKYKHTHSENHYPKISTYIFTRASASPSAVVSILPHFPTHKPCGVCPPPEKVQLKKKTGDLTKRGRTTFVEKNESKIKIKA